MNDRRPAHVLVLVRGLVAGLALACMIGAPALAQNLPPDAAEALGQAQRAAAAALIEYTHHTTDRPLWAEALRLGRAAADAAPTHPAPQRFLAQANQQVGFYARAWEAWEAYRSFGGTLDVVAVRHVVEVARWMGIAAYDAGRQVDSIPYFLALLDLSPHDPVANERVARTYLEQDEPLRARPFLEALGGAIPDLVDDLEYVRRLDLYGEPATQAFAAGLAAAAAGDLATALARYGNATRAAPEFVEAWRALVDTALALGRIDVVEQAAGRLLALEPNDPTGLAARSALARVESERIAAEEDQAATQAAAQEAAAQAAARSAAEAEAVRAAEAARAEAEREAAAQAAATEERATTEAPDEEEAEAEATAQAEAAAAQAAAEAEARAAAEREAEAARLEAEAQAAATALPADDAFLTLGDARHVHRADGGANPAIAYIAAPALETDLSSHVDDVLQLQVTVLERIGDAPMWFQFCLVPPDVAVAPACSAENLLTLGATGTYQVSLPWRTLSGAGAVAWQRGVDAFMWVLRRPDGTAVAGSSSDAEQYLPTSLRVQAIAVPTGR